MVVTKDKTMVTKIILIGSNAEFYKDPGFYLIQGLQLILIFHFFRNKSTI